MKTLFRNRKEFLYTKYNCSQKILEFVVSRSQKIIRMFCSDFDSGGASFENK